MLACEWSEIHKHLVSDAQVRIPNELQSSPVYHPIITIEPGLTH